MDPIIPYRKTLEHDRLVRRLDDLRAIAAAARADAPDMVASPALAATACALLRDIYRLISREPFARTLPRFDPAFPPSHRQLTAMLRDAGLALELFRDAHIDHHPDGNGEWLTLEDTFDLE